MERNRNLVLLVRRPPGRSCNDGVGVGPDAYPDADSARSLRAGLRHRWPGPLQDACELVLDAASCVPVGSGEIAGKSVAAEERGEVKMLTDERRKEIEFWLDPALRRTPEPRADLILELLAEIDRLTLENAALSDAFDDAVDRWSGLMTSRARDLLELERLQDELDACREAREVMP
jgi:hypothetical protein